MAVNNRPFTIYRGQDWTATLGPSANQTPFDITGWTMTFYISRKAGSTVLEEADAVIVDASAGTFTVSLTETQTASLSKGKYVWDIWRTNTDDEYPISSGQVVIAEGVYQPPE